MSKKDYQQIARVIRDVRARLRNSGPDARPIGEEVVESIQYTLSGLFAADNPRFDGARFAVACDPAAEPHRLDRKAFTS